MKRNELKRKLQRGEVVLGPFMNCSYPAFIEIVGLAGFDFAIIDMEHGPLEVETAEDLCRAGQGAGLDPIVRVRKNDAPQIQRALDIGSAGVQVPQIETREQAEAVVRAAKYQPIGMRGISLFTRSGDYSVYGLSGITDRLNEEQMIVIHIEGVRGLENLEQIITVPHIDVIFLGPYDLSQSFGVPGQIDDPRVINGMRMAVGKIRDAGKAAGTYANDVETAKRWIDAGVQYISLSVDVGIFATACRNLLAPFRSSGS
ncbi:MAG: aldolase [Chloroflexi bacterium]|nr:aldolase [Chloroflexota bacterium]